MTTEPRWNTAAPYPAVRLFITALDYASHGDADRACIALADSDVHPAWFRIQAIDGHMPGTRRHHMVGETA